MEIGSYYEFFSGGGMARAGFGKRWRCLFANDFDLKKCRSYISNWGNSEIAPSDVRTIKPQDLPEHANLVWASFPCQDLSLAGGGAGLKGERSGTFWPFWDLMKSIIKEGRAPEIIVLENVCGALTSHGGKDFAAICSTLQSSGYRFGVMMINAELFVPQSRPRLFVVAIREEIDIPGHLISDAPQDEWHSRTLKSAFNKLPTTLKKSWLWWRMPLPPRRTVIFADLIEDKIEDASWHTYAETKQLLAMMDEVNLSKVRDAKRTRQRIVGTLYRRTRHDKNGNKVQRAEVRFDGVAGCLRTPAGGSSRQLVMVVEGKKIRSRLISIRETARLMGLSDDYVLPDRYNEAYHLTGDGVVVPVVRHLSKYIFEPLLKCQSKRAAA